MTGKTDAAFRTLGGEGDDCLLIHGFASDRMSWLANVPALLPAARVHVLDLPGHGESLVDVGDGSLSSLADHVDSALAQNNITRVHLIGHSLGGGLAMLLAAKNPEMVASLALIAPAGLGIGVDPVFLAAYPEANGVEETTVLLRSLVVRPQIIGKQLAQRVLDQLSRAGAREALRRIAHQIRFTEEHLLSEAAPVIARNIPRMVLWGAEDNINRKSLPKLKAFGGEFHLIEEAAHLPQVEKPKETNGHLVAFLKSLKATG